MTAGDILSRLTHDAGAAKEQRLVTQRQPFPQEDFQQGDGGFLSQRPSDQPEEQRVERKERTPEEVVRGLAEYFPLLLAEGADSKNFFERYVERGGTDEERLERQKELEILLFQLEKGGDHFVRILQSLKGRKPGEIKREEIVEAARGLRAITKRELGLRREVADAVLQALREEREKLRGESAFVEIDMGSRTFATELGNNIQNLERMEMAAALEAIEELLYEQERPDPDVEKGAQEKHLLYIVWRGNRRWPKGVYPKFRNIAYVRRYLNGLLHAIDPQKGAHEQEATKRRIENALQALQAIELENPIAHQQYLAREMRPSPLYAKPLRLAGLGIATVAGVMAVIPVLRKLWKGQDLSASDWPAAAWPVLAGYLSGFLPLKSKGPLAQVVEAAATVQYAPFHATIEKIGLDNAVVATKDLHEILREPSKRTALKRAIKKGGGISLAFLQSEEFIGEELEEGKEPRSKLLAALSQGNLTDQDRLEFLSNLFHRLKVDGSQQSRLDAAIAALGNPELMRPSS